MSLELLTVIFIGIQSSSLLVSFFMSYLNHKETLEEFRKRNLESISKDELLRFDKAVTDAFATLYSRIMEVEDQVKKIDADNKTFN